MSKTTQRRFVVARSVATVFVVLLAFALVVPNYIVPESGNIPRHFAWSGLMLPFLVSAIAVYCLWFWR